MTDLPALWQHIELTHILCAIPLLVLLQSLLKPEYINQVDYTEQLGYMGLQAEFRLIADCFSSYVVFWAITTGWYSTRGTRGWFGLGFEMGGKH